MNQTHLASLKRALPIILLIALTVGFFSPVIFQGKTFYAFDMLERYPPWQALTGPARNPVVNNTLITDPVNIFYTAHGVFKQALQGGTLPFWNHRLFSGIPYTPYFGSPVHYLLFSFLPITTAHDLLLFLHMTGTALMMFLYLKKMNMITVAALFGAVSWMFNGYLMVWFEFENVAMMALTLPGILYFVERWFRQKSWGNFLGLSGMLSLAICVGYAHLLIYELLLVGIYILVRYRTFTPGLAGFSLAQHARALSGPVGGLLVAVLAGSLFFTSHLSLMADGHREPIPFTALYESTGELPARYLLTLIFPSFYGSPTQMDAYTSFVPRDNMAAYPYNNFNELCIYGGIITLLFAIIGSLYCRQISGGRFFVAAYLLSMAIAMGSIIYWPLATFVPGLSLSTPTRVLYISAFAMSVLAAFGMQLVLGRQYRAKWPMLLVACGLVVVTSFIILAMQFPLLQRATIEDWLQAYHIPWIAISPRIEQHFLLTSATLLQPLLLILLGTALLFGLLYAPGRFRPLLVSGLFLALILDQVGFAWHYNTRVDPAAAYPSTPGIEFLQQDETLFRVAATSQFLTNSLVTAGIDDIGGYASFFPRRYGELIHLAVNKQRRNPAEIHLKQWYAFETLDSPILNMLNARYLLAPPFSDRDQNSHLELVYQGEMDIYENKRVLPRAYFVPEARFVRDRENAYELVASFDTEDFRRRVIIEEGSSLISAGGGDSVQMDANTGESDPGVVCNVHYGTNSIGMSVNAPRDGYLVVSTNYHPDWRISIERQGQAVVTVPLLANYAVMAVPVMAGVQQISFTFEPRWQIAGLYTSAVVWCLLFLAMLYAMVNYLRRFASRDEQLVRP